MCVLSHTNANFQTKLHRNLSGKLVFSNCFYNYLFAPESDALIFDLFASSIQSIAGFLGIIGLRSLRTKRSTLKICRRLVFNLNDRYSFIFIAFVVLLATLGMFANESLASSTTCKFEMARIVSVQGTIEIRRAQDATWELAGMDSMICAGDTVRARSRSRAALRLRNESMLRLDQKTSVSFPDKPEEKSAWIMDLLEGAIHVITRTPKPFRIKTPFVNASVEGTEFSIEVRADNTEVVVDEGRVSVYNESGSVVLHDHEVAVAYKDKAPSKNFIINPTDAVQWSLYYPAPSDIWSRSGTSESQALIQQAGFFLDSGQVDEAQTLISRMLLQNPNDSDAHALLALIAIVQNDKERALTLANQAIMQNPMSTAAYLVLSYAQQAHFEIEAALDSAQKAVALDVRHALAWARSAELHMSLGDLDRALDAARRAVSLNPSLAKTQTILGFAHLLNMDTQAAKDFFHQAIILDQADPMPRLGLGIALIRQGNLEPGRIELEIAASLDPANSLIRSYLGKAYFEEKRYALAATQFDLAKERDPNDPTPWFYDAIQKQTQNRPTEALRDIQKSIELNDNRAVYRSKLLLDRDEAARGSSLARIFENLRFERRAVMETAKSLSFDPANHSAHRFLSDTYANIPRHEAARVSELLQAQLLQPINVNPVQPHMAVADLNIITNTGPSSPGFNEFTPLMERSKPQLVTSGIVGNNGSLGNEVVFSKVSERTSISLGQFHYETNGFRKNNDQNHDILNAFFQHALTSKLNIQTEVRTRSTHHGNLLLDFERDSTNLQAPQNQTRRKIDEDTVRAGARYQLTPTQSIIASGQYINRNSGDFIGALNNTLLEKNEGYQTEAQYQFINQKFNLIAGSGAYRIDVNRRGESPTSCCLAANFNRDKTNGYIYTNLNINPSISATAGFSYDAYKESNYQTDGFNPKFGLQWNLTNHVRLRMAWLETLKAPLATQQTIEPTQVAGFTQLFDDLNGTKSRRMGIGMDTQFGNRLFGGFEISSRNLHVPTYISQSIRIENQKEQLYRGYVYGLLHTRWTARSEIQFEKFSRAETNAGPHQIDTLSIPTGIDYFNPQGFFANVTGTFVRQEVDRRGILNEGIDKFFLVDASVGFRLPNRRGIVSLEGRNLFDEHFLYRNANFMTPELINPRFIPTRTIFARVTFSF